MLNIWTRQIGISSQDYNGVEDPVWIDIETRKVDAPQEWVLKRRWQPFMAGLAYLNPDRSRLNFHIADGDESDLILFLKAILRDREARYAATREFDEMVLKGLFTNARSAHSEIPGNWPHLSQDFRFKNMRNLLEDNLYLRSEDCASKDVPRLWEDSWGNFYAGRVWDFRELVRLHCLRDVLDLVVTDPQLNISPILDWFARRIYSEEYDSLLGTSQLASSNPLPSPL